MPDARIYATTVTAVVDLTPWLRRLTLSAPEIATFAPSGPDEYIGLLMPADADAPLSLPSMNDGPNVRAAVAAMPEAIRPDLRWYTVRAHRPDAGEIDVDMVVHGDQGPGTRFARRARVGAPVGVRESGALYEPPPRSRSHLLVGDETSLPAIARILETQPQPGRRVFLEIGHPDDASPIGSTAPIDWVHRAGRPGDALEAAVRAADLGDVDYAWVCGERTAVQRIRRHLADDRGVAKTAITFSGYWCLGRARG